MDDVIRHSIIGPEETMTLKDGTVVNKLEYLNGQDYITTYRCFQEIDGELYPPMAENVRT